MTGIDVLTARSSHWVVLLMHRPVIVFYFRGAANLAVWGERNCDIRDGNSPTCHRRHCHSLLGTRPATNRGVDNKVLRYQTYSNNRNLKP